MLAGVLDHAQWVVLALILANQAGVPGFAVPALLGVGALAWTGGVNVGVAVVHALEYPVGGATHCAHGAGNGLLLPFVMRFNLPARPREFATTSRRHRRGRSPRFTS